MPYRTDEDAGLSVFRGLSRPDRDQPSFTAYEQMLVATDDLDVAEIERQLERMVGAENPRLQRLAELKTKLAIES